MIATQLPQITSIWILILREKLWIERCSKVLVMNPLLHIFCIYLNTLLFNLDLLKMSNCQGPKWKKLKTWAESLWTQQVSNLLQL